MHVTLGPDISRYMPIVFNYDESALLRSQLISISLVTTQETGAAISIPGIVNIPYLP
jgi:hypothetical protein